MIDPSPPLRESISRPGGRGRRPVLLALGMAASGIAACGPSRNLASLPPALPGAYRLGPGDELRVTVFEEPRLSGTFRVGDTGTISVPLLGTVPAAGATTTELRQRLDQDIQRRGLLEEPRAAVEVVAYRSVFVLGEVERAGAFAWQPGLTALGAIALAGGFSPRAVRDRVTVQRAVEGGPARDYAARPDAMLEPGDVLTVPERRF